MAAGLHPNLISPDEAYVVVAVEESYPIKGDVTVIPLQVRLKGETFSLGMHIIPFERYVRSQNIDLSGFNPGLKMRVYSASFLSIEFYTFLILKG
jgi:hypothetical protein